jgi:predicted Fe-Mo cluster-binding NifX family protein
MKVAFPTRDNETISRHFGKMTAIVVIDLEDGAETERESRDMASMPACGGEDHGRPDFVAGTLDDCDIVIANGIGMPLADHIRRAGTEVVLTTTRTIDEALSAYLGGTIRHEPTLAHPARH